MEHTLDPPIEPVTSWPGQLSETEIRAWRSRRLYEIGYAIDEIGYLGLKIETEVVEPKDITAPLPGLRLVGDD